MNVLDYLTDCDWWVSLTSNCSNKIIVDESVYRYFGLFSTVEIVATTNKFMRMPPIARGDSVAVGACLPPLRGRFA